MDQTMVLVLNLKCVSTQYTGEKMAYNVLWKYTNLILFLGIQTKRKPIKWKMRCCYVADVRNHQSIYKRCRLSGHVDLISSQHACAMPFWGLDRTNRSTNMYIWCMSIVGILSMLQIGESNPSQIRTSSFFFISEVGWAQECYTAEYYK